MTIFILILTYIYLYSIIQPLFWPNDTFDHLAIYDGKNQNGPVLSKVTGQLIQGETVLIKSTKRDMFIRFQSDSVLSTRGFQAVFSYMLHGLGSINFCSTSQLCEVDQGHCDVHGDHECAGGLKCGAQNCPASLEFEYWVGCCYEPWWKSCPDSLNIETRTLVSPQYPSMYENNQHCEWLIQVNDSKVVTLDIDWLGVSTFQQQIVCYSIQFRFQLGDVGVHYDALRIYDGNSSKATLLAEISGGYHYNVKVKSTGPQMFIIFDSDELVYWVGFHATFREITFVSQDPVIKPCSQDNPCHEGEGQCYSNKQCSGTLKCGKNNCPTESGYDNEHDCCYDYCEQWLDMKNGIITSPEHPNPYNNNEECIWTIFAEENQTVLLHFLEFEVSA